MRKSNAIRWVNEKDLLSSKKAVKEAARQLHLALTDLGVELEYQGYTPQEIHDRLRKEFFAAAREVLKEEG